MTVFGELPPEDLAALRDLAHDVMAAIVQAGLPARLEDAPGPENLGRWSKSVDRERQ